MVYLCETGSSCPLRAHTLSLTRELSKRGWVSGQQRQRHLETSTEANAQVPPGALRINIRVSGMGLSSLPSSRSSRRFWRTLEFENCWSNGWKCICPLFFYWYRYLSLHTIKFIVIMCTIQWVVMYSQPSPLSSHKTPPLCNRRNWKKLPTYEQPLPVSVLTPKSLAAPDPPFVSVDLTILDISYKWNHTISDILCLAFSSIICSRFIHVVVCVEHSFFRAE